MSIENQMQTRWILGHTTAVVYLLFSLVRCVTNLNINFLFCLFSIAMNELKNSPYKEVKAAVCASRAQLCINPDVKNNSNANIIYKCRSLTKNNGCVYKNNVYQSLKEPAFEKPILDIEDLCNAGQIYKCCPYYASKELRKKAEIVFLPYNYLLDPKIRDIGSIDLKNAIVILDEAHNVEKACEQNACTSINTTELDKATNELEDVISILLCFLHTILFCYNSNDVFS